MRRFRWPPAAAYLLLASVYLLYWNHGGFFVDDWILLPQFRAAMEHGAAGVFELAGSAIRNRIYGVFRTQWLSILYGFAVTVLGGYSVRFNYLALLFLHTANAWLLCQALWRLGCGRGLAFLAGVLFLLSPATHWDLFTYLTNPFYVFATFWALLMLWLWTSGPNALPLAIAAVLGMFSGEQVFLLLWLLVPLAIWLLPSAAPRKQAVRKFLPVWSALATAGALYALWISEIPIRQGYERRYEWTWRAFENNVRLIGAEMVRFSGLIDGSFYRLSFTGIDALLATGAAALVVTLVCRWTGDTPPKPGLPRIWLIAILAAAVGYGPTLWLAGGYPLRYHYVPSPFLALAAAAVCFALSSRWRRLFAATAGGLATGLCVLAATADIRQCWIPQSEHQRLLDAAVRNLKALESGDILVVDGTPFEIGTAQHFSMHSPEAASGFVEWVTGVRPKWVTRELYFHEGRWSLLDRTNHQVPLQPGDLRRTHVLVFSQGKFIQPHWAAYQTSGGAFGIAALRGSPSPTWPQTATFSREQLALMGTAIYFPRSAPSM